MCYSLDGTFSVSLRWNASEWTRFHLFVPFLEVLLEILSVGYSGEIAVLQILVEFFSVGESGNIPFLDVLDEILSVGNSGKVALLKRPGGNPFCGKLR
mgnify:CR=1 FL=1